MRRGFRVVLALAMMGGLAAVASPTATGVGVTGTYIVVLEPGATSVRAEASSLARQYGGRVGFVYGHALRGFSITASGAVADALARNPKVSYVEADQVVTVADQTTPTGLGRIFAAPSGPTGTTPVGAPYNAALDIDGNDDSRVDADVAVIDTGIDLDNRDLKVMPGVNCLIGSCVSGGDDDHYHGTHVAGTVAALDNNFGVVGVAPGARLWPVKVLNSRGSGSWAVVIAGIDWVAGSWAAGSGRDPIEVANMSLGGGKSQAVNDAVARAGGVTLNGVASSARVTMVVAAGNSSADVNGYSPASEPSAITVSALADFNGLPGGGAAATCYPDTDDTFAGFSNYGALVDIIAPGVCITSTNNNSSDLRTISGTSMASPHVAGAAALLRSMSGSGVASTESLLRAEGNSGWSLGSGVTDDGVMEPLLDVHNSTVFDPRMVVPSAPPPPASADLTFAGSASQGPKGTWNAAVTVTNGISGTAYTGIWSVIAGGTNGCTANESGTCAINLTGIAKRTGSVTWTHTGNPPTVITVIKP